MNINRASFILKKSNVEACSTERALAQIPVSATHILASARSVKHASGVQKIYVVTLLRDINTGYTRFYQTEKIYLGLE